MVPTFGRPLTFNNVSGGTSSGAASQSLVSTDITGLTVTVSFSLFTGNILTVSAPAGGNGAIGQTVGLTGVNSPTGTPSCDIASVDATVKTSNTFLGGTSVFSNTFLNVDKSIQTPIYIDYNLN